MRNWRKKKKKGVGVIMFTCYMTCILYIDLQCASMPFRPDAWISAWRKVQVNGLGEGGLWKMFMYLNDPLSAFCYGKLEMYAFLRRKEVMKVLLLLVSFKYFYLLYNIVKILFKKTWKEIIYIYIFRIIPHLQIFITILFTLSFSFLLLAM